MNAVITHFDKREHVLGAKQNFMPQVPALFDGDTSRYRLADSPSKWVHGDPINISDWRSCVGLPSPSAQMGPGETLDDL